jgi:hypothetical protein
MSFLRYVVICGSLSGLSSAAALALAGRSETRSASRPINATSHWLHGDDAAAVGDVDARHTGVGLVTHQASAFFWAVPFSAWLASRPPRSPVQMVRDSAVMAAVAAAVDYGLVPRRLTPGWELVLSKRGVASGFLGLAFGFAVGGWLAQKAR